LESEDAGIELIICHTSDIACHDLIEVQKIIDRNGKSRLIGPGSFGVITPGYAKVGTMPGYIFSQGSVGVMAESDTLCYEVICQLSEKELGQSSCVGIGQMSWKRVMELCALFDKDERTDVIVMLSNSVDGQLLRLKKPIVIYDPTGRCPKAAVKNGTVVEDFSRVAEAVHESMKGLGKPFL